MFATRAALTASVSLASLAVLALPSAAGDQLRYALERNTVVLNALGEQVERLGESQSRWARIRNVTLLSGVASLALWRMLNLLASIQ